MKKRPWLRWVFLFLVLLIVVAGWRAKTFVDEQPQEHVDPGVPEVMDLPDPEDVE